MSTTFATSATRCLQAGRESSSHGEGAVCATCPHHPRSMMTDRKPFCPDLRRGAQTSEVSFGSEDENTGSGYRSSEIRKAGCRDFHHFENARPRSPAQSIFGRRSYRRVPCHVFEVHFCHSSGRPLALSTPCIQVEMPQSNQGEIDLVPFPACHIPEQFRGTPTSRPTQTNHRLSQTIADALVTARTTKVLLAPPMHRYSRRGQR